MTFQTVLTGGKVPVKIWSPKDQVETQAMAQLTNIASLPFVFKHVAAMPDVHLGKGATVGSVVATKGAVCPCAVGVDIGCGMIAIRTSLNKDLVQDKLPQVRHSIERSIPVGHNSNKRLSASLQDYDFSPLANISKADASLIDRAKLQLGTLGGGNHFIEICLDTEGRVWIMLHSGSRNLGKVVAERHIHDAKNLMKRMFIDLIDPDLAYFVQDTPEFKNYWNDLQIVQAYAMENRAEMVRRVVKDLKHEFGEFETYDHVNCHHNYASLEHHYGENVIITRKGAVNAAKGQMGIIPGSMGTKSYIVRGLGSQESFNSCSHGAGRKMSRNEAKKHFTLEDLAAQTAGVECRKDIDVLDEIPGAYKDIDQVMENQKDLVETVAVLKQILCVKG